MPETNGDLNHWRGVTDAEISHIFESLNEVKSDLRIIKAQLDSLTVWRAKVVGAAMLVSAMMTAEIEWAMKK